MRVYVLTNDRKVCQQVCDKFVCCKLAVSLLSDAQYQEMADGNIPSDKYHALFFGR